MDEQKLTKNELAALDLMIASMQEDQMGGAALEGDELASALGRIARAAWKVVKAACPYVTPEIVHRLAGGGSLQRSVDVTKTEKAAPGQTLEQLIEFRKRQSG